jgi:hypothetical protein
MKALLETLSVPLKEATFVVENVSPGDISRNRNLLGDVAYGAADGVIVGQVTKFEVNQRDNSAKIKAVINDRKTYDLLATGVLPTLAITDGGTKAYLTDYLPSDAAHKSFKVANETGRPLIKRFMSPVERDTRVPHYIIQKRNRDAAMFRKTTRQVEGRINPNIVRVIYSELTAR